MNLSQTNLGKNCKRIRKPSLLTWGDWGSIVVAMVASALPTIITAFMINLVAVQQRGLFWKILGVLILVVLIAGLQHRRAILLLRAKLTEGQLLGLDQLIEVVLQQTVNEAAFLSKTLPQSQPHPTSHLRANIMLVSCDEKNLHIVMGHNMDSDIEKGLIWARSHGVCGVAWDDKKQISVDLTLVSSEDGPKWRYASDDHRRLTMPIKSLICTPIYWPIGTTEVIGILNLDSTEPMELTRFNKDEMFHKMQQQARLLSRPLMDYITSYRS